MGQFMRKYRVELLTFSDGRGYQYEQLLPINRDYQRRVKEAIEGTGETTVIEGREIIGNNATPRVEASRIEQAGVDVVIFNYAIWCFPHLSAIAAKADSSPDPAFLESKPLGAMHGGNACKRRHYGSACKRRGVAFKLPL